MSNNKFKAIIACVIGTIVSVTVIGYFKMERAKIEAQKQIQVEEIHKIENIERTEERSQFWQKLVPWGEDEQE